MSWLDSENLLASTDPSVGGWNAVRDAVPKLGFFTTKELRDLADAHGYGNDFPPWFYNEVGELFEEFVLEGLGLQPNSENIGGGVPDGFFKINGNGPTYFGIAEVKTSQREMLRSTRQLRKFVDAAANQAGPGRPGVLILITPSKVAPSPKLLQYAKQNNVAVYSIWTFKDRDSDPNNPVIWFGPAIPLNRVMKDYPDAVMDRPWLGGPIF